MKTIMLEVRDNMTFIPVLAINLACENGEQRYLLSRAGYGLFYKEQAKHTVLIKMAGEIIAQHDPFDWKPALIRTMSTAHKYIRDHFDSLKDGDVIDVEFILGETEKCKTSEQYDKY